MPSNLYVSISKSDGAGDPQGSPAPNVRRASGGLPLDGPLLALARGSAIAATTARTATPAQTQKPLVKAASVGRPRGVVLEVMTAATTAVPMQLPMVRAMVLTLVASPVCVAGTLSMMALDMAAKAKPMPAPVRMPEARTCQIRSWDTAGRVNAATTKTVPRNSGSFGPNLRFRMPARGPKTTIMTTVGSRNRPACDTDFPKPYPVASGSRSRVGTSRNVPNMAKPSIRATRSVAHTPRIFISFMSMSGSLTRSSTSTNAIRPTTPRASRPMVLISPQPQAWPLLMASSSATSDTDRTAAPSMSSRPGERTGDSFMPKIAPSSATATRTNGSQNSQCHERCSTIGPAATMPTPAPMPKIAEIRPMMGATFSRGSSSRIMPIDSGRIAPAAPWSTRPAISTARFVASAATSVPAARAASTPMRTLRLPAMSPSRPRMGVRTDADSRYAVTIQLTSLVEAFSSRPIVESAGETSDWSTANARPPSARYSTNSPPPVLPPSAGADPAEVVSSMV